MPNYLPPLAHGVQPTYKHHLSIHRYWITGGPETGFSEEDYYRLLAEADATEDFVKRDRGTCA